VLSDFRKENYEFFKSCFAQSVTIAKSLGMVSLSHVSLDGSMLVMVYIAAHKEL